VSHDFNAAKGQHQRRNYNSIGSTAAVDFARTVRVEEVLAKRRHHHKRNGKYLAGPCPVCGGDDRFSVTLSKNIWYCRGCAKGGDVIALVQHIDKCGFLDAVETLSGKRPERRESREEIVARMQERERQRKQQEEQDAREAARKTANALRIWEEGVSIWETLAGAYMASRHCDGMFPPDRDAVFRFHQHCPFGENGERFPCLIALLRNIETDAPQAIHRTALTPDGQKIDRKVYGPKSGAAIKLWPQSAITDRLVVGEGIETTLSTALHADDGGSRLDPAWSLIDAGGIRSLPPIPGVNTLIILVDNDVSGTGQKAAHECAQRWNKAGRKVIRLTPKVQDTDFNDVIKGNSHAA
jgi:phage/plasmid primase-like uncharacterized protein